MKNIGLIGVGQMGKWMSTHLLKAGYQLSVYDINKEATNFVKEKGGIVAESVQEIGEKNDVVITMLTNSQIVESVINGEKGLASSMKQGGTIIDMSSSYALSTKQLAKDLEPLGISLVDAPVSGGVKKAKEGTLIVMVGADEEKFKNVLPILECMGSTINYIGKTSSGHALKAINNYLSATSLYATSEAMILAKKLGLDLDIALETINESSGQSFSTHYKFPTFVLPRKFDSEFSLDLLLKDVKMVISMAEDKNVPVLLGAVVEQIYKAASLTGEEKQDHTEIIKFIENLSDFNLEEA